MRKRKHLLLNKERTTLSTRTLHWAVQGVLSFQCCGEFAIHGLGLFIRCQCLFVGQVVRQRQRLKENASIHTICALDVATGQSGKSCAKGVSAAQTDLEKEEA